MELDELEELFHQVEKEVAEADRQYDEWRKSVGLMPQTPSALPQHTVPVPPPKAANSTPSAGHEPMENQADRQIYGLRQKFFAHKHTAPTSEGTAEIIDRWQERPPAEMSTGELHLLARKELATGKVTEKAHNALLILKRRTDEASVRSLFLYAYAVTQQAVSEQGLEELCRQLPKSSDGQSADHCLMYAAYCIAKYISNVSKYVRDMAEHGYRNRQKILEEARQQAQQKLEQAQMNLNRL